LHTKEHKINILTLHKDNNSNKTNNDIIIIQTHSVYNSNNVHNIKEDILNILQGNRGNRTDRFISADIKKQQNFGSTSKN